MGSRRFLHPAIFLFIAAAHAQVIEFESSGLKYKALTHNGITVMFAPIAMRIHDYAILQVAVSNGSPISWAVRPEDFATTDRLEQTARLLRLQTLLPAAATFLLNADGQLLAASAPFARTDAAVGDTSWFRRAIAAPAGALRGAFGTR